VNTLSRKRNQFSFLLIFALLGCCAVLTFSSCSKKASVAIIGKWQVQGEKDRIEFRKDGTVLNSHDITAGPPGDTRTFTEEKVIGKYTFTDGNHMNFQMNTGNTNNPPISIICVVHIHGDKMDMTMAVPQQHKVNFKRLE
jgi:uncharacterized Rossmann fold enzyme